jgi:hypothetical protein
VEQFDEVVRSIKEFKNIVWYARYADIPISYISFDHDLGSDCPETTGYACAKWLVDFDMKHNILTEDFTFNVHSANPVGARNIRMYMDQYLKSRD